MKIPSWTLHTILQGQTTPDNVAIAPIDLEGHGKPGLILGTGWKGYNTKDNSTLQWLQPGQDVAEPWTLHPIGFDEVALHRVHVATIDGKPRVFAAPLLGAVRARRATGRNQRQSYLSIRFPPIRSTGRGFRRP